MNILKEELTSKYRKALLLRILEERNESGK